MWTPPPSGTGYGPFVNFTPSSSMTGWTPMSGEMPFSFSNSWLPSPAMIPEPTTRIPSRGEFVQVSNRDNWTATEYTVDPIVEDTNNIIEEEISTQNLYKTELCRSFEETGICRYGAKCQFAHGKAEQRPVLRHPKYKTEVCKTFFSTGSCPYGRRCRFIHSTTPVENSSTGSGSFGKSPTGTRKKSQQQRGQRASPVRGRAYSPAPYRRDSATTPSWSSGVEQESDLDSSWIDAMGSLTISPPSDMVQLVVPPESVQGDDVTADNYYDARGRLSFFQSIANK